MSAWRSGKIRLACSIEVLQKVLVTITPEWKDRIDVDLTGTIPFKHGGNDVTCHIVIPSTKGANYSPVGFRQEEDGQWTTFKRDFNLSEGRIKKEIASIKIKEEAESRRAVLVEEEDDFQQKRLVFHVPVDDRHKYNV